MSKEDDAKKIQSKRKARNTRLATKAAKHDAELQVDELARRQAVRDDSETQRQLAAEQYDEKYPAGDPA